MKVRNVSPLGDLFVPALGRDVKAGEVTEVAEVIGGDLLAQPDIWVLVKESTKEEVA